MSETTLVTKKHSGGKSTNHLPVYPILAKAQAQKVIANKWLYWEAFLSTCFRTKLLSTQIGTLVLGGVRMQPSSLARVSKHLPQK